VKRSHPEWISVGDGSRFLISRAKRRDGFRLVEPDNRIELPRQRGIGVMAEKLGVGAIDHADEAFEARFCQPSAQRLIAGEIEQEALLAASCISRS
jgi:hypothetical protein